jgi:hypothetical protein
MRVRFKTAAPARRADDGRFQCTWYRDLPLHAADDVAIFSGDCATPAHGHRLAQQEDHFITATVSSSTKADACNSSMNKAFNLRIIVSMR